MTIGGGTAGGGGDKKRQCVASNSLRSSTVRVIDSSRPDDIVTDASHKPLGLRRSSSHSILSSSSLAVACGSFNDHATADVIIRLYLELKKLSSFESEESESVSAVNQSNVRIYLHSDVIRQSKYFAELLSDWWQKDTDDKGSSCKVHRFSLRVPTSRGSIDNHITVLQLLYTNDLSSVIDCASTALLLIPVALELLFEDCVRACVRFLEVVPWTEEEEKDVLT